MTRTIVRITWNVLFRGRKHTHEQRTEPQWYRYRWGLWKQYTEPSLLRQTWEDFDVWLMCDPKLCEYTRWMESELPDKRFRVVYDWHEECRLVSQQRPERVVIVRIDNDDAYAADALATYHAEADNLGDRNTIQLADGWVWDATNQILYESANPSPAFLALVGTWKMMQRRFPNMGNHSKAQFTALRIPGHKWVMVYHGNNVCNRAAGAWIGEKITGTKRGTILAEYGITGSTDV